MGQIIIESTGEQDGVIGVKLTTTGITAQAYFQESFDLTVAAWAEELKNKKLEEIKGYGEVLLKLPDEMQQRFIADLMQAKANYSI